MNPLSRRERLIHLSDGMLKGYHLDEIEKYIELYSREQVEEVLDRLEAHWTPALVPDGEHPDGKSESEVVPLSAIEAERNKLKESK